MIIISEYHFIMSKIFKLKFLNIIFIKLSFNNKLNC